MSELLILNKSFTNNKESKIFIDDENLIIDSSINKMIPIKDITNVTIINSRCPKPWERFISFFVEIIAFVVLTLAIIFRKNQTLLMVFILIALAITIINAVITKIIFKKSADAIEFFVKSKTDKARVLGVKTTEADYNKALRLAKECKKINKLVSLDFQTKK